MDPKEFAKEKFGLRTNSNKKRFLGLIPNPNATNTPEELVRLDEIYNDIDRTLLPDQYDSRALGMYFVNNSERASKISKKYYINSGYVTKVKDQYDCGSCVAFSTTAALEICFAKAGAPISGLDISEQHFVDCGYDKYGAQGLVM